jgi:hypothetical protein
MQSGAKSMAQFEAAWFRRAARSKWTGVQRQKEPPVRSQVTEACCQCPALNLLSLPPLALQAAL